MFTEGKGLWSVCLNDRCVVRVGASIDILAFYANVYDFTSIFTIGEPILTQLPQGDR